MKTRGNPGASRTGILAVIVIPRAGKETRAPIPAPGIINTRQGSLKIPRHGLPTVPNSQESRRLSERVAVINSAELAFSRHANRADANQSPPDSAAPSGAAACWLRAAPGKAKPSGSDVTAPGWLVAAFAVLMLLVAGFSAGRLAMSSLLNRSAESVADSLHVLMGVAMAGMLEPRLSPLPDGLWRAVFAVAAAWFTYQAVRVRAQRQGQRACPGCVHPAPHAVECFAMVYMLLPAGHAASARGPAMAMPGMSAGTGSIASNPALALMLALFMLGYILWTADRLATRSRSGPVAARPAARWGQPHAADVAAGLALAPRVAACCSIVMALTMGYMLLTML